MNIFFSFISYITENNRLPLV